MDWPVPSVFPRGLSTRRSGWHKAMKQVHCTATSPSQASSLGSRLCPPAFPVALSSQAEPRTTLAIFLQHLILISKSENCP